MQAALEDLAPEQVEEHVQAAEEQDRAEEDGLEDRLVHHPVAEPLQHRLPTDRYRAHEQDDDHRNRCRQAQDHGPARHQQPAQLEPHQPADLPAEQRPVDAPGSGGLGNHGHDGSSSSAIR